MSSVRDTKRSPNGAPVNTSPSKVNKLTYTITIGNNDVDKHNKEVN